MVLEFLASVKKSGNGIVFDVPGGAADVGRLELFLRHHNSFEKLEELHQCESLEAMQQYIRRHRRRQKEKSHDSLVMTRLNDTTLNLHVNIDRMCEIGNLGIQPGQNVGFIYADQHRMFHVNPSRFVVNGFMNSLRFVTLFEICTIYFKKGIFPDATTFFVKKLHNETNMHFAALYHLIIDRLSHAPSTGYVLSAVVFASEDLTNIFAKPIINIENDREIFNHIDNSVMEIALNLNPFHRSRNFWQTMENKGK